MTSRTIPKQKPQSARDIARAISLFFAVRGRMRTKLAGGTKLDPSSWLRIETMKFIADHTDSKMKDVAEYLSITAPSATSLIRGLVKSGLVAHCTDDRDHRVLRLALTAKGRAELASAIVRGRRRLRGLFAVLSDEELQAFIGALEKIRSVSTDEK